MKDYFLLSLENAIFRKIYWKFQNQMNLSVKIKDLVLIMLMIFGLQSCSTQKQCKSHSEPVKTVEIALEKPKIKKKLF